MSVGRVGGRWLGSKTHVNSSCWAYSLLMYGISSGARVLARLSA